MSNQNMLLAQLEELRQRIISSPTTAPEPVSVDVRPALGHDPLMAEDLTGLPDGDLPDVDLVEVLRALRELAAASAATAAARHDLCGVQWQALYSSIAKIIQEEPKPVAARDVAAMVGTGPDVEWLRSQHATASAKGDSTMAAWFAAQARKFGVQL